MRNNIRKQTKFLTVSAMLIALGVVFLALGSVVEVMDISVAVIASLLCSYAVIELGGAYPWFIWLGTSILGLIFSPLKTAALFYALSFGFYPILKEKFETQKSWLSYLLKIITFHAALGAIVLVLSLFLPDQLDMGGLWWMPVVLYFGSLIVFLIYDYTLTKLITLYLYRWRKRFRVK